MTDGVVYVPRCSASAPPLGLRGAGALGVTRGTERAHVVRRCSRASPGGRRPRRRRRGRTAGLPTLRVDGGMSANPTFVQAVADAPATGRGLPVLEAATMGGVRLAGLATGAGPGGTTSPRGSPGHRGTAGVLDRDRWRDSVGRAAAGTRTSAPSTSERPGLPRPPILVAGKM